MVLLRRDRYNNNREIKQGNYFFIELYMIVFLLFISFVFILSNYFSNISLFMKYYIYIYIYIYKIKENDLYYISGPIKNFFLAVVNL
jgi:hypothetical protein